MTVDRRGKRRGSRLGDSGSAEAPRLEGTGDQHGLIRPCRILQSRDGGVLGIADLHG
jgi:hypothetical protein